MRGIGSFMIAATHPSLPGHFPGRPVVPGAVLLDEIIALLQAANPAAPVTGFTTIRFHRPVRPGDCVTVTRDGLGFAATVADATVLRGVLTEDASPA